MSAPVTTQSQNDPRREFAVEVVQRLQEAGHKALWAGGCVRDFLLGRAPQDYDVATSARPEQVREIFGRRRTRAVGANFGVILVHGPKDAGAGDVEVATFRTEGPYRDGRRPESVEFSSPEEDARRRDFTINGIFYDPVSRTVHDFVGGEKDLAASVVRAIGDPHDRMREDKLRMLRAVRFAATLEFALDTVTADGIREMAEEIHVVSAERIAQELRKMLVDRHRRRAMELAADVRLLGLILPELEPLVAAAPDTEESATWERTLTMLGLLQEPSFELAAAVLLHAALPANDLNRVEMGKLFGEAVGRRLKLSNLEIDRIGWLLGHEYDLVDAPNLRASQLKRLFVNPWSAELLSLVRVETLAMNSDLNSVIFCEEFLRAHTSDELNPPQLITGQDLIKAGLKPGTRFRDLLETVRDAQLNGEIRTTDDALALVQNLLSTDR